MGWGNCGTDSEGRNIGYSYSGSCDHKGCKAKIHRGLDHACGGMHGNDGLSCERYFCEDHRDSAYDPDDQRWKSYCLDCTKKIEAIRAEEFLEVLTDLVRPPAPPKFAVTLLSTNMGEVRDVDTDELVGRLRWDSVRETFSYHDITEHVLFTAGSTWDVALHRFNELMQPSQPPTAEEHRKAVYALLLRWDEVDYMKVDRDLMTESEAKYVEERQQSYASIAAMAHEKHADA